MNEVGVLVVEDTESQNHMGLEGTSGDHLVQPPATAGPPRAGPTGTCTGGSSYIQVCARSLLYWVRTEKAELPNAFFALVFTAKAVPHESQTLETRGKVWREEDFPSVEEDQIRDHLAKLDIHKSMGPDGMHPLMLRELADVIAGPLSIIFERSWRTEEVPEDWRKASITPAFKKGKKEDPGNYRPVSLTSVPGKVMERLVLDVISKHGEEQEVIGNGQHGFTKGKSRLTNLTAFYDVITGWLDEGRAADVIYLDFSKAFDAVSHNTLIRKRRKCGLDEGAVRWIENWLGDRTQEGCD
ncbi:rna-directed dna polymerase from mobile element jockey- hypothetical protein [Limosa lapponica baueri]|uniref:Reverse transcriptase domain-containing protein n=1 Tax=Limosa lapponica baueri TaxID=1758121 RepID=A0A2I0T1E1_LIMLA|nr:rna-directed dna polymerase from mobile element jockey- hypothetical protein [Limosa lapponica baueri]